MTDAGDGLIEEKPISNGDRMSRSSAYISEPRVLLSGLAMPESPRWHNGRLVLNWGADEIVAVDLEGNSEVMGRGSEGEGWAVNWLPDERMLITGKLVRVEHDGLASAMPT